MSTLKEIYQAIPTIVPETVKLDTSYLGVAGTLVLSDDTTITFDVYLNKNFFGANQSFAN